MAGKRITLSILSPKHQVQVTIEVSIHWPFGDDAMAHWRFLSQKASKT